MGFAFEQKVLFRHCDPAGIVFYPRYFEMMNDCVEAFFAERLACPFEKIHPQAAVPTAEISARFRAPSRHGDRLCLVLDVRAVGRTSAAIAITATCDGAPRFDSRATLVHVDAQGRPARWPDALRAGFDSICKGSQQ